MQIDQAARSIALERLDAFVGEWNMEASFPDTPLGRTVFEWLPGGRFLLQRWEVPHPDAPDGIAVIRFDPASDTYSQHYFDSRGVARVYAMSFRDGVWGLLRDSPDLSPLDFLQRFTGAFSGDGSTIRGRWESSWDGTSWERDFDLTYTKII
jgi:hypothetical protein